MPVESKPQHQVGAHPIRESWVHLGFGCITVRQLPSLFFARCLSVDRFPTSWTSFPRSIVPNRLRVSIFPDIHFTHDSGLFLHQLLCQRPPSLLIISSQRVVSMPRASSIFLCALSSQISEGVMTNSTRTVKPRQYAWCRTACSAF